MASSTVGEPLPIHSAADMETAVAVRCVFRAGFSLDDGRRRWIREQFPNGGTSDDADRTAAGIIEARKRSQAITAARQAAADARTPTERAADAVAFAELRAELSPSDRRRDNMDRGRTAAGGILTERYDPFNTEY